ncbi:serine-proline rich protein [Penicillium rubens]|uniref:serine-proline rich protein n=1 Tax=Penicillium rubens TaxID=1108849 RepID=UPI002A5A90F8|nr:serine-proline rich protein [Penicillium rubens]KAJ5828212.1 serine-proline rich protein [Penicillium rubens]
MVSLMVGLQDFHPKYGPEWHQDACSDLVNQIGRKLEQIGRMESSQQVEILERAERGGYIRWYDLASPEGIAVSTYRESCENLFSIWVVFEDRDSAMNPVPLSMDRLRIFARAFGTDLEQLRKLTRAQITQVGFGLESAFVKDFQVQGAIQGNPAASLGNCYMDATQPPPSLSPPSVNPCVPANDIPTTCDKTKSSLDNRILSGDNEGSQMDWPSYEAETAERTTIPVVDPNHASIPQPLFGIASPGTTSTPELDRDYSTPSTVCVETPRMREQHTFPAFGASVVSQASDTNGLSGDLGRQSTTTETVNNSNHAALNMLQSCSVSLENDRIQRILEAEAHLLAQDLDSMLRPLFDHWDKYGSLDLHALGLPVQWKGIQAAVDYLRVLDADATSHYLNPVAKRIGHVLLYFNYEELCKHPEKYCPRPSSKRPASHVLDCILDTYPDDPRITKSEKSRRNKISTYYVRRGKWWWALASNLGVGILLAGDSSPHDVMCNHTFTDSQTKVFVTFVQKTRPGTVHVFKALEPVVKHLMFGRITYDLRKDIFDKDVGLLRSKEMVSVREDDERALAFHWTEISWKVVDVKKDASQKMTEFLS